MNSIYKANLFEGKKILITGGGSGIGLRTARELVHLGAKVAIAGRDATKLDKGLAAIKDDGGEAVPVECNIRDEDSVRDCITACLEKLGGLDMVVNNAGGQFPAPAETIKKKGWHAVVETNLTGTFLVCREAFTQGMRETGGVIVNIVMNMWNGLPRMAHSSAARAGVENLTKTLASEWGRRGVRINSVAPGIIESSGLDTYAPEFQKFVREASKFNQASRGGTEAETAAAILFLLSPAAAYITGETLRVDGGESIFHPYMPPVEHDKLPAWDD